MTFQNVLKFYMDLGIDGFRIDAILNAYEDERLLDEPRSYKPDVDPEDPNYLDHIYTANQPETYALVYEWRKFVDEYVNENGGDSK